MNNVGKTSGGTQSVLRALALLKLISTHHESGIKLPELVTATSLERATTYRLVTSLVQAGFVERDAAKRYRLGIHAMQMGLDAMSRAPMLEACKPAMQAIARESEDMVYMVVRNGDYGHTLHREVGAFPIRAEIAIVGGLRPLGLGAGGQTLLALLEDEEIDALHARNRETYEDHDMPLLKLREIVRRTRRNGHSTTASIITPGVNAIGKAFALSPGVYAAFSVAAIKQRMDAARDEWLADLIDREVAKLGFNCVK
jgi:DNA-binding IclR family transcriptional regulator